MKAVRLHTVFGLVCLLRNRVLALVSMMEELRVKTIQPKHRITPITDRLEIESIRRNADGDIIGGQDARGNYFGYYFSVERFRTRKQKEAIVQ